MIEIKTTGGRVLYTAEDAQDVGAAAILAANDGANLRGANLYGANLCDFKPDSGLPKRVAEQILASPEALNMSDWHTCDTSHCLAGWAVHLSGPPGYALEAVVGPEVAGRLLMPSASHLFHASDDEAREWAEQILAAMIDA